MNLMARPGDIIFLLVCVWVFATNIASGQLDQSLMQAVQTLEQKLGLPANSQNSVVDRVCALEQRIYGQAGNGSLLVRLGRLRQTILGVGADLGFPGGVGPGCGSANNAPESAPLLPKHIDSPGEQRCERYGNNADPLALVNVGSPHFVRVEPPGAPGAGDYFGSVMKATKGKVFRFKAMPIPVYVTPISDRDFTSSVIAAFESWEERTSGLIRFVQVSDPEVARIKVTWKHLGVSPDDTGCTLGAHTITKWNTKGSGSVALLSVGMIPVPVYIPKLGPKYSVPPQIIEVNLDLIEQKNREIRYQVLENVVTHELGHALGILGHSPNKQDMMYPLTDEHSRLSSRDINTITRIYNEKADIPL